MNILPFLILVGTIVESRASNSSNVISSDLDGRSPSAAETSGERSPQVSYPVLEKVDTKKHLVFVVEEEEEQETTYMKVDPNSEPADEDDERYRYSSKYDEDQLQKVNGTAHEPTVSHGSHSYMLIILVCLGALLIVLMLFAYYFKWNDRANFDSTDYNFFFFKIKVIDPPLVPDV